VDPVTVSVQIAKPREAVFEYLADVANHAEFTDHFLENFRMLSEETYGRGAGARFKVKKRFNRFGWGDFTFIEVDPPRRIVAVGRAGKYNRVKTYFEWTLEPAGSGTKVQLTAESEPAQPSDRLFDPLGGSGWFRRKANRALRRLQTILEDGSGRGARATVAGS
jgi:uncharacterized protein YndB with AHSA1/START domain